MKKQELIKKLQDIEWQDFEVKEAKSAVPKNSWETVSAFCNTSGGWLIFGVSKKGKEYSVTGVDNPEKIEHDFLTALRSDKINRKIKVEAKKYSLEGKSVLAFNIPSVYPKDKPVYFNTLSNTFIRTGSGDQRATKEEIDALYRNSSFDKKDEEPTQYTFKDLDKETITRYRTYLKSIEPEHRYNEVSAERMLELMRVIVNGKVTIGGALVFGTEEVVNRAISDFRVEYLEVMGKSFADAQNRYDYRMPVQKNLYEYYFSIFEKLLKHINIPFKLKGFSRDENQPQVIAIREALVNLLMHTDYFSNAKPRIRILSDRIEFFNPGSLPKDLKYILKEEFSMPRNNTIARIFRTIKLSENIGSGFHKMFHGWTSYYKRKPKVDGDFDYYKIMF
ncbi:MAG: putative DNA binding domain-containing protein [Candidatus Omnitrophica bacterium]|nr:putative DNA binding domain-containing protein [Candidatus Omnitrophota bacterium]